MTVFIGIDPGLSGACAFIWPDGSVSLHDTPTVKTKRGNDYLVGEMAKLLDGGLELGDVWSPLAWVAALEQGIAMPKQSSSSTFKTGRGIGLWEGILATAGIPYELVTPVRWKQALGIPKGADKGASRLYAARLFPQARDRLSRVKDDGRAEALLLAEWRRRQESNAR